MQKIIRITENDLLKIIKKVIKEQTEIPIDQVSGNITKKFGITKLRSAQNFLTFKFVGIDPVEQTIHTGSGKPTTQSSDNVKAEVVVIDKSGPFINYLKSVVNSSLNNRLKNENNTNVDGNQFNIITTKLRQLESEFLTNIGYDGDPTVVVDVRTWIDRNVTNPRIVNRSSLMDELNKYLTKLRKYNEDLMKGVASGLNNVKINGFPTFPIPRQQFTDIKDNVTIYFTLQILGNEKDGNQGESVESKAVKIIAKAYNDFITEQISSGTSPIIIPAPDLILNYSPRNKKIYDDIVRSYLVTRKESIQLVKFVIYLQTVGGTTNRIK